MIRLLTPTAAAAICAALLIGPVTSAQAGVDCEDPKFADHPQCPGSGGGGGDTGILAACDLFRDAAGDIVKSDIAGDDYCHKVDGNVNVGERHRLDTGKLNKSGRVAAIDANTTNCDASIYPGAFAAVSEALDITIQVTSGQICNPDFGSPCNCATFTDCTAADFDPGDPGSATDLRDMAQGGAQYRSMRLHFTPTGRELATVAFNANDDEHFTCPDGLPVQVRCVAASGAFCEAWEIEGKTACFEEAPSKSANPTVRALCEAPFQVNVTLKP